MVYIHLAEGFEEVEALTVVDLLRRADIEAQTVSITKEKLVKGAHGINIEADILFEDADYDICDTVVFPGGMPGAENLKNHKGIFDIIEDFSSKGKNLAAICAAPMVFANHKALEGKKATVYPGFEKYLDKLVPTDDGVVEDENLITGKGPAYATLFALAIIKKLRGSEAAEDVAEGMLFERA